MIRAVLAIIIAGFLLMDAAAAAQDTTAVSIDLPAPEEGVIRVHFGPPVGIRPTPLRRAPQSAQPDRSEPTDRVAAPGSTPRPGSYVFDYVDGRPALLVFSDIAGAAPDTV